LPNPSHSITNKTKHFKLKVLPSSRFLVQKEREGIRQPTMISAKRIAQLAKKWQRMAALGRKRLN